MSPGNPSILSAEIETAAKLAAKPTCCLPPKAQLTSVGAPHCEEGSAFARTWLLLLTEEQQGPQAVPPLAGILAEHTVKQHQGGARLGSENSLALAHERWEQGVPQMIQWVAGFPLSSCQKCLPGTWLRGSEYRGGWKANPSRATPVPFLPLCLCPLGCLCLECLSLPTCSAKP